MRICLKGRGTWAAVLTVSAILLAAPTAIAQGTASVRFVHAVPGAEAVGVSASSGGKNTAVADAVGFGEASPHTRISADAKLTVTAGSKEVATSKEPLKRGTRYTIVATGTPNRVTLRSYEDGRAVPGRARIRTIHVSPELGQPDVLVDGEVIARKARFGEAADYEQVQPGLHDVSVNAPGEDRALFSREDVALTAGTATTALLVGSAGEPTRLVLLDDDSAAPRGAPAAGLGALGEEDGPPAWPYALVAALLASLLGATGYASATAGARPSRARRGA